VVAVNRLAPPLFEVEKFSQPVSLSQTPFFYNDGGRPAFLPAPPAGAVPIDAATTDPDVAIGREHVVDEVLGIKPTPPYGVETQLGFRCG
jgi:hypothetical protein